MPSIDNRVLLAPAPNSHSLFHLPPQFCALVGRETLDETPQRALKFLRGVGTSLPIRAALAAKGYSEEDHTEGWSLLHAASGYAPARPFDAVDVGVRDAIRELDAWDEDGFRVVSATLTRRYPAVAAKVLGGIGPSTGPAAVVGVKTLLDRLDSLEKSKDKEDRDALALLAKRGIDKDERKRLGALVDTAQAAAAIGHGGGVDPSMAQKATAAKHLAALTALRGWYDEWSTIARACVKRRDHLILLGMAKRKSAKAATPPAPSPAANVATASATAATN